MNASGSYDLYPNEVEYAKRNQQQLRELDSTVSRPRACKVVVANKGQPQFRIHKSQTTN